MGQTICVFTVPVDCEALRGQMLSEESVADFLSPDDWMTACRNGWYQSLLQELLQIYRDCDELRYLTEQFALVPVDALGSQREAIRRLLAAILENPQPFVDATPWYGATVAEVWQLDDDSVDFGNFFSFLASQAAALQEAETKQKCVLHATLGW